MAATTLQAITQQASNTTEIKEFLVPTILSVNLKKTSDDRLPILENENTNKQNGGISRNSTPSPVSENEDKNFPILLDHENLNGNLEILDSGEDDEDVVEMAPLRNRHQGPKRPNGFVLEPFFKPIDHGLEANKENPVLKSHFNGRASPTKFVPSWMSGDKPSMSACHPFKKAETSPDLTSDTLPIQTPKSLLKKSRSKSHKPLRNASVLKEIQLEATKPTPESPKSASTPSTSPLPPPLPPAASVSPKSSETKVSTPVS